MRIIIEIKTIGDNTLVDMVHEGEPKTQDEAADAQLVNDAVIGCMNILAGIAPHSEMCIGGSEEFASAMKRKHGF